MKVHASSAAPVPRDRVVMVLDMTEEQPCWEFARWGEDGNDAGWYVGDHFTLRGLEELGLSVAEACPIYIEAPTHWAETPALPIDTRCADVASTSTGPQWCGSKTAASCD